MTDETNAMGHGAVTAPASGLDLTPPVKVKKEKVAKEPKAPKEPKEDKEPKAPSNRAKLSKTYPEDAELSVLVEGNPKKAGSRAAAIFEFYRQSTSVGEFFAKTADYTDAKGKKSPGNYGDITYDVGHGFIKVG